MYLGLRINAGRLPKEIRSFHDSYDKQLDDLILFTEVIYLAFRPDDGYSLPKFPAA